jgi:hypothetical protein
MLVCALIACGPPPRPATDAGGGDDQSDAAVPDGPPLCTQSCSADLTQVVDCNGNVIETCGADSACGAGACMAPCAAADVNHSSIGCDYYATAMAAYEGGFGGCLVTFVANTWTTPAVITASWGATPIDLAVHARIPRGAGPSLTYDPYDPVAGLAPGDVAIIFLANDPTPHGTWVAPAACPIPAAVGLDAHVHFGLNISSGRTNAFHIATSRPVVAYQMLPYNAASSASTGATLLLPTSAWHTSYVGVTAYRSADFMGLPIPPSMAIIARDADTDVTIRPTVAIRAGIDVAPTSANVPITYKLAAGQTIEFIQADDLTGSAITATKPIAVFAGHMGLRVPFDMPYSEHAEQQIPPVRALGSEYAVGTYRDRLPPFQEQRRYRVVGAVDGTALTFDPPIAGAPSLLGAGASAEFASDAPFVVRSQDADHPFLVFAYMGGSEGIASQGGPAGYGDAEFVRVVPGAQYLKRYVFFTDPTYPETNLVVVRRAGAAGFADVQLDCFGTLGGWQPVGSNGKYQATRVDLSRHAFEAQGACNNGRHEMTSSETFGLTVWGWGTPETRAGKTPACSLGLADNSCDVSYAYPAGENVLPINDVVIF